MNDQEAEEKQKCALHLQSIEAKVTGGKKGETKKNREGKLAVMRDEDGNEDSSQMLDIIAVEWSIHPFLLNLDSYVLELSPCKKQSRIKIHKIANAFYLKSLSQGYIKT